MSLIFANNTSATVTSGGTTAPAIGTSESWTVSSLAGFPVTLAAGNSFHVADSAKLGEKIQVTAISGTGPYTWTVTRGSESTTTIAHSANFVVQQVVTSGDFTQLAGPGTYNVKAFGAKGDGTTDDTTAIQNAVTAASAASGKVYFPTGTYIVSATITVTGDGVVVEGAQRGDTDHPCGTIVRVTASAFTGTSLFSFQQSGTPARPLAGCGIRHISLDGNAGAHSNIDGVFLQAFDAVLDDIEAAYFSGNGVHVQGLTSPAWNTYNTKLINSFIHNNTGHGTFWDTASTDTLEVDCTIYYNTGDGSHVETSGHFMVGNHYYSNSNNIFLDGVTGAQVVGCEIEDALKHGIVVNDIAGVNGCYGTLISGCDLYNNGNSVNNTYDDIIVAPNQSRGCQVSITGNIFHGNQSVVNTTRYGVNLNGAQAQACTVIGNWFATGASYATAPVHANGNNTTLPCIVADNTGVNPAGVQGPPSVPATTVAFTNPYNFNINVYIHGGTVTVIAVNGTTTGLTSGSFWVGCGQTITLTYSVAPTWVWMAE